MTIEEIFEYTEIEFNQLTELLRQLNPNVCMTKYSLDELIDDPGSHLYVMRDDAKEVATEGGTPSGARIIGTACLCVFHQPFETDATIEAVVVHNEYRGRHLGRRIIEHLIGEAERLGVNELHLTSNPARVAANALYQSMGFTLKETNFYIKQLDGASK